MTKRSQALDILRAAAILLVLFRHSPTYLNGNFFLVILSSMLYRGGWVGVDLFFVLSGYLIAGLLFDEFARFKTISFKTFFIRRGFKIYPLYYVMTLSTLSVLVALEGNIHRVTEALPWLVYLQDYVYTPIGFLWGPLWSLAVEEKFYICLPLLLILLTKVRSRAEDPFKWIPAIFAAVGVLCLGTRVLLTHQNVPYQGMVYLAPFHVRMDSLFFGVLISYWSRYHADCLRTIATSFRALFLWGGIALLVPAFLFRLEITPFIYSFGFTLFYIGGGLVLMSTLDQKPSANVWPRALAYIGVRSYSIYLWHFPVRWFLFESPLAKNFHFIWITAMAVFWTLAIGLGIVASNLIEMPLLRFRDRRVPSRA